MAPACSLRDNELCLGSCFLLKHSGFAVLAMLASWIVGQLTGNGTGEARALLCTSQTIFTNQ